MMVRTGSISEKRICDSIISNAYCPKCQMYISAPMLRIERTGRILFIPFIKSSSAHFTICPNCEFQYQLRPQAGNEIMATQSPQLLYEECCYYLNIQKTSTGKYSNRSNRKVWIGTILALFFGIFGIQNLYMGHVKRFLISILLDIVAIIMFITAVFIPAAEAIQPLFMFAALFLAVNVYWGIVDCIRILSGHAKDGSGCYIMTNRQYSQRMKKLSTLQS